MAGSRAERARRSAAVTGERLEVLRQQLDALPRQGRQAYNRDTVVFDARGFVAASDGFVQIVEIKPSSKRVMAWEDFVNGRHVAQGDRFLSVSS